MELGNSNAFSSHTGVQFFCSHALQHTLVERMPVTTENAQPLPGSVGMTKLLSIERVQSHFLKVEHKTSIDFTLVKLN